MGFPAMSLFTPGRTIKNFSDKLTEAVGKAKQATSQAVAESAPYYARAIDRLREPRTNVERDSSERVAVPLTTSENDGGEQVVVPTYGGTVPPPGSLINLPPQ